jgi:SAM-dependent methyltransferase
MNPPVRAWTRVLDALPPLRGQTVLDLGCGTGEPAAALSARGARVIGVDASEDSLREARARGIANAEFRWGDLREPLRLGVAADGVWACYSPAYFPGLEAALARWTEELRPGGWVALTEIDDFLGHEPVDPRTRRSLEAYAREALVAGRYDFSMGRSLARALERLGFAVERTLVLEDPELAFSGPASPEALDAWRLRLERMTLLQRACGADFPRLREDFLACLARPDHRSTARVIGCLARRAPAPRGAP